MDTAARNDSRFFNRTICEHDSEDPTTWRMLQYMKFEGKVILPICTIFAAICVAVFVEELVFAIRHFHNHRRRSKTMVVLSVYTMFAVTSCTALWVPRSVVLMDLVATGYFSYVLYTFVNLITDYYGGRRAMIKKMKGAAVSRQKPPFCCCCFFLPKATFSDDFFAWVKMMILQCAILKPICLFIAAVLWTNGSYNPGSADFSNLTIYVQVVTIVSTFVAVYGMMVFLGVAAEGLPSHQLKAKFYSVQLVLLTTSLLGLIINMFTQRVMVPCWIPFSPKSASSRITNMVYLFEMVPLCLMGRAFFLRPIEYQKDETDEGDTEEMQNMADEKQNNNGHQISSRPPEKLVTEIV